MNAAELQDALAALIEEAANDYEHDELAGIEARTYTEEGVLTTDAGLVLHLPDGSEMQLTIVQSRYQSRG